MNKAQKITEEDKEKSIFGKEKIEIEIPKHTRIMIISTVSATQHGGFIVNTSSLVEDEISEKIIKEDK